MSQLHSGQHYSGYRWIQPSATSATCYSIKEQTLRNVRVTV